MRNISGKTFLTKNIFSKCSFRIFGENIFWEIFLAKNFFGNFFGKNIFGPPPLTAHSPLSNIQPPPLLTPLISYF